MSPHSHSNPSGIHTSGSLNATRGWKPAKGLLISPRAAKNAGRDVTTKRRQCVSLTSTPGRQLSPGSVPRRGTGMAQLPSGAFSHQRLCLSALRGKNPTDTLFKAQSGAMESQSTGLGIESLEEATQALLCPSLWACP